MFIDFIDLSKQSIVELFKKEYFQVLEEQTTPSKRTYRGAGIT